MSTHDHDDGLVHAHGWASDAAPRQQERPAPRPVPAIRLAAPQERDDGLVHGHGWACTERGRMARQ